uniref:Uncharacterized protein n=1 Tax=Steinernema glaseri TaxID=37863 RepID=A0A1I7Z2C2_9BILA
MIFSFYTHKSHFDALFFSERSTQARQKKRANRVEASPIRHQIQNVICALFALENTPCASDVALWTRVSVAAVMASGRPCFARFYVVVVRPETSGSLAVVP